MLSKGLVIGAGASTKGQRSLATTVKGFFVASAQVWRIPPLVLGLILVFPFLLLVSGVMAGLFGKSVYLWFTGEDGLAENLQVLCNGIALLLALFVVRRYRQLGDNLVVVLYLFLCCGLIFLIGEEISWGQRIFGWSTTGVFAEINGQDETNLHNIVGVDAVFKWVQLLVGAYGFLALVVGRLQIPARWRRLLAAIIPPVSLLPYFSLLFFWKLYRNLVHIPGWEFRLAEFNEVLELIFALGILLFMVFQLRKERLDQFEG